MGMGAWGGRLRGHRGRIQPKSRLKEARKRGRDLGRAGESGAANVPGHNPGGDGQSTASGPQNISNLFGNAGGMNASESSSPVAVDPANPTKLVAVWIDNDPSRLRLTNNYIQVVLEGAYSVNGGQSWLPLLGEPTNGSGIPVAPLLFDPTTSGPTHPYQYQTDPSLGFDDSGNFYILDEYHSAATAGGVGSGAWRSQKFTFTGSTPSADAFSGNDQTPNPYGFGGFGGGTADLKVLYQWDSTSDDLAIEPTMTVDDNVATAPTGVTTQPDAFSGDVYVAWTSVDHNTAIPIVDFNPNRIKLEVSSDGGNNFSPLTITGNGNFLDDFLVPNETAIRPRRSRSPRGGCPTRAASPAMRGSPAARSRSPSTTSATTRSWPTRCLPAAITRTAANPGSSRSGPTSREAPRSGCRRRSRSPTPPT